MSKAVIIEHQETLSGEHGIPCGNCGTWRNLIDGYFIEKCSNCHDDEIHIFETDNDHDENHAS